MIWIDFENRRMGGSCRAGDFKKEIEELKRSNYSVNSNYNQFGF